MKFLEGLIKKKVKSEEKSPRILPEDVRYALKYKESVLDKADLETLLNAGFINETLYLTFKTLVESPDKQKDLLEKYISLCLNDTALIDKKEILQDLLKTVIQGEENISVKGAKLAQISRQDFSLWERKFNSAAKKLSESNKNVYLLANTMFLGLESFARAFREKDKTLNILVPDWVENGNGKIGYRIDFNSGKGSVEWLEKYFPKSNAVIVDDTTKTGASFKKILNYWEKYDGERPETMVVGQA